MSDRVISLSPRGWAALILCGGVVFAVPFLRSQNSTSQTLPPDSAPISGWPSSTAVPSDAATDAQMSAADWEAIAAIPKQTGLPKASGPLPSTSPATRLPAWADHGTRVDQLVDASLHSQSLAEMPPPPHSNLKPLSPWVADQVSRSSSRMDDQAANSLAAKVPASDRWSTPAQQEYVGPGKTVRFEANPSVWPDQKADVKSLIEESIAKATPTVPSRLPANQNSEHLGEALKSLAESTAGRLTSLTESSQTFASNPMPQAMAPSQMSRAPLAPRATLSSSMPNDRPRQFIHQPK